MINIFETFKRWMMTFGYLQRKIIHDIIEVSMSLALKDSPLHHIQTKPIPSNLTEAIASLDKMLADEAKDFLRKGGANAVIELHSSLGRYLRNKWKLWANSELAQYMRDVEKIDHPDDMSHAILIAYCNSLGK